MDKAKSNIEMSEVTPKLLNLFGAHIKFSEKKSRNSGCPKRGITLKFYLLIRRQVSQIG